MDQDNIKNLLYMTRPELRDEINRLRDEVDRLTKAHSDALADFWNIHKGYFDLKSEVEQLRKKGK